MSSEAFERYADRYDEWFDKPEGSAIFAAEVACLDQIMPADVRGWVEVGVGSGRFAAALNVLEGVDPSPRMLEKAAARGITTKVGRAEKLPYPTGSLQGLLLVVTLCFLDNPQVAMSESARALEHKGRLLVGIVPGNSPWGRHYRQKGDDGHPFYSVARFYTTEEVTKLAEAAGFEFIGAASTLRLGPDESLGQPTVLDGIVPNCGFVGMLFRLNPQATAGRAPTASP